MKLFRKVKAFIMGTFVADCPVCHKHFYGHNGYHEHVRIKHKNYRFICNKCMEKQKKEDIDV